MNAGSSSLARRGSRAYRRRRVCRYSRWAPFVLLVLVSCGAEPTPEVFDGPVEWAVNAEVDKRQIQVGEDFVLSVTVTHPPGQRFIAPYAEELRPFDLIERSEERVSAIEDRIQYRLAAYRLPETLILPALEIQYRGEGEELASLSTPSFEIEVVTSLTPQVTEIHDIKGPVELEVAARWSMLWWLLLALILAALAYLLYRRLARKEEEVDAVYVPPPPPADQEALLALSRLEQSKLLETGKARRYHDELSEIVKRYAGRRFRVPYLEQTTHEILRSLRPRKVAAFAVFAELLQTADLVKFAKLDPGVDEGRRLITEARRFVETTRPRQDAQTDSSKSEDREARSA